ncbi:hypothetical protein OTU49_014636, partial [Cherax quadricarinatus]
ALKMGGKFMLNGDWLIDWPGEVEAGGTSFTYSRAEDDSETLSTLGPTTDNLTLMVLLREHNPGIHYEYWTPNTEITTTTRTTPLLLVSLPQDVSNTTSTTTTTTTTITTTITTTTTSPTTPSTYSSNLITTTTTTTPRPAVLTSVNKTKIHRPLPPPRRSDNEVHITSPMRKPKKPIKIKDGKRHKGEKQKGKRGQKGKGRKDKIAKKKRGKKGKVGKKEPEVPAVCAPCEKPRQQTKQMFCTSDFVSRVEVLGSETVGGERRYEVLVHQSYKNTVPLLHKEFLWVTNPCQCPLLRHGRSYLVMGITEVTRGREVRLVLTRGSYVRRYKPQNLARILRIRHNEMRFCRPWRRDLRFVQPAALNETDLNAT